LKTARTIHANKNKDEDNNSHIYSDGYGNLLILVKLRLEPAIAQSKGHTSF